MKSRHLVLLAATVVLTGACGNSNSGTGTAPIDGNDTGGSSGNGSGGSQITGTGGYVAGNGGATNGTGGAGSTQGGSGGETQAGNGGTSATGGAVGAGGTDAGAGCADPGAYPAGPYGNTVGATITNLPLQGYVNKTGDAISNTLPWVPAYSLDDVRKTCVPYLLMHVSDFVCPGCQHAAKQLGIDGKGILEAGGGAMDILSAKLFVTATTRADLDAWVTTADENVDAFIDADSDPLGAMKVTTVRETAMIIQIPNMKIVWLLNGDVTGATPPSIVAASKKMHELLGK